MSLQERLNLLVRTDIRLLETCDLRLNGLFFPKYILVLFIGYKTDLMSDPAKSEIRIGPDAGADGTPLSMSSCGTAHDFPLSQDHR